MLQFRENDWTDEQTGRPFFIGFFRPLTVVQQKIQVTKTEQIKYVDVNSCVDANSNFDANREKNSMARITQNS